MGGVRRIKNEGLITWVSDRQWEMGGPLLRSNQEKNLTLRIHRHIQTLLAPGCCCLSKRGCCCVQAVGRAPWLLEVIPHGLHCSRRGKQIGASQGEVDQRLLLVCCSELVRAFALIIPIKNSAPKASQSLRGEHPQRLATEGGQWPLRAEQFPGRYGTGSGLECLEL